VVNALFKIILLNKNKMAFVEEALKKERKEVLLMR